MNCSFKSHILSEYWKEIVALIRRYSKEKESIARHRNNIIFDLRCKKHGILPPSLRIKPPIPTVEGQRIARQAGQQFLNEHLRVANYRKAKLTEELKWTELGLRRRLNEHDYKAVTRMADSTGERTFQRTRDKQREKMDNLCARNKKKNCDHPKKEERKNWVINLSSHQLTEDQRTVLERGLNFAPTPKHIPTTELITGCELALRDHPNQAAAENARAAIANIIRKAKPPKSNISRTEQVALRELKNNEEIIIARADKGNTTVLLDSNEYETKAKELLDAKPFQKLSKDPTPQNERRVNTIVKALFDKKVIDKKLSAQLRVSPGSTRPALFYGLPKIHKANVPLRPIVSSLGTATYELSSYLSRLLTAFITTIKSSIKNTSDFCEQLQNITIEEDEILVSYDVKSLYTSIPIDDTLDIITHKLSHDNRLKDQTSLSPQDIRQLLNVCLKTTNFKFRDSFYQLTDGVAMGSPASSHVANLFMEHLEEQAINTAPSKPKIWKRFVDDIFAIVKRQHH